MGIFTIPIYVMQKPVAERDGGMFWGGVWGKAIARRQAYCT